MPNPGDELFWDESWADVARAQTMMEDRFECASIVFVVDDEAEVREGLRDLLACVGLKSAAFASTADFLKSKPPNRSQLPDLGRETVGPRGSRFPSRARGG